MGHVSKKLEKQLQSALLNSGNSKFHPPCHMKSKYQLMGSGSSRNKVERFDKGNQMPPVTPQIKPSQPPSPSKSYDPFFTRMPAKIHKRRASTHENIFELDRNIDDYSSVWDNDTKLSSTLQQSLKSDLKPREYHQKETLNNKSSKKSSTNFDSAHVESLVDTQTHSYINISSSEKIDELINSLNRLHSELDLIIKRRTEQISTETESILSHILNETHKKQQRLLSYAKEQQLKQDDNYQKLLQEYISQLDEMKAKDLADLQSQLQIYREQILEESQLKIMTVNEQTNLIKTKIVKEEQQKTAEKIDLIIAQIQQISTDEKLQHLGSELITKTNIITNAHVGTKASGQDFTSTFEQNDSSHQRPQSNKKKIAYEQRLVTHSEEKIEPRSTKNVSVIKNSKLQQ